MYVTGDCKISQDGGAFSNSTNLPSEISGGRYSLTLTAAEMDGDHVHIILSHAGTDPVDLLLPTGSQPSGVVVADGGNSATAFVTDLSESTDDYWKDALLLFTSGTMAGQLKKVSAYTGSTKTVTCSTAFTAAPSDGDRFVLLNE